MQSIDTALFRASSGYRSTGTMIFLLTEAKFTSHHAKTVAGVLDSRTMPKISSPLHMSSSLNGKTYGVIETIENDKIDPVQAKNSLEKTLDGLRAKMMATQTQMRSLDGAMTADKIVDLTQSSGERNGSWARARQENAGLKGTGEQGYRQNVLRPELKESRKEARAASFDAKNRRERQGGGTGKLSAESVAAMSTGKDVQLDQHAEEVARVRELFADEILGNNK